MAATAGTLHTGLLHKGLLCKGQRRSRGPAAGRPPRTHLEQLAALAGPRRRCRAAGAWACSVNAMGSAAAARAQAVAEPRKVGGPCRRAGSSVAAAVQVRRGHRVEGLVSQLAQRYDVIFHDG